MDNFVLRDQRFAGFWKRAQAGFIDAIILIPFSLILRYVDNYLMFTYKHKVISILSHALIPYMPIIYEIFFLSLYSQTPGMMRCNIKIIDTKGKKTTLYRNLFREIILLPSFIFHIYYTFYINNLVTYEDITFPNFTAAQKWLINNTILYKYMIFWALLLMIVNVLFIFRNYMKQTLGDLIAGTYVVYDKTEGSTKLKI